jgi:hypothetical protein
MLPSNSVLILPSGKKLPARIRQFGTGRGDAVVLNTSLTHIASVPRHSEVAQGINLFDGTYTYYLHSFKLILGRYRLELERLH